MSRILSVGLVLLIVGGCVMSPESASTWDVKERVGVHTQLAYCYLDWGMLKPAKEEVEFALKLDPLDSSANHAMALVQIQLDQTQGAEQRSLQGIELDARNWVARNSFGRFVCERGCATEGIGQFQGALGNPFKQQAYISKFGFGICCAGTDDWDNASFDLKRALKGSSDLNSALYQLPEVSYVQENYLSARDFLERYFKDGSSSSQSLLLAVHNEMELGADEIARNYARLLRSRYPSAGEVITAMILLETDDHG